MMLKTPVRKRKTETRSAGCFWIGYSKTAESVEKQKQADEILATSNNITDVTKKMKKFLKPIN